MNPNKEEQLVIDSLREQGYTNIQFEPDGNIPPDILLNDEIAIEVRRLNQNIEIGNGFEGIEQAEYSFHGLLRSVMKTFPTDPGSNGAFVGYHFKRPLPSKKELRRLLHKTLKEHRLFITERRKYKVNDNIILEFFPASKKLESLYKYGLSSDDDSGGLVVGLVYDNLKLVIREKEGKVSKYKSKYDEWWLALVDTVGFIMDEHDIDQFNNRPKLEYDFDRILLVSPMSAKHWRFLYE